MAPPVQTVVPTFTVEEKLQEIQRELGQRNRVYPFMIRKQKITKEQAQRQMQIMQAIAKDYADKAKEGPLFAGGA